MKRLLSLMIVLCVLITAIPAFAASNALKLPYTTEEFKGNHDLLSRNF